MGQVGPTIHLVWTHPPRQPLGFSGKSGSAAASSPPTMAGRRRRRGHLRQERPPLAPPPENPPPMEPTTRRSARTPLLYAPLVPCLCLVSIATTSLHRCLARPIKSTAELFWHASSNELMNRVPSSWLGLLLAHGFIHGHALMMLPK